MPDSDIPSVAVTRILRARQRVERAERELYETRLAFYREIATAVSSGAETQTSVAEALGISRQRVAELIGQADEAGGLRLAAKVDEGPRQK